MPGFDTEYLDRMGYFSMTNLAKGMGQHDRQMFYGWKGDQPLAVNYKNFCQIVSRMALQLDGIERETLW